MVKINKLKNNFLFYFILYLKKLLNSFLFPLRVLVYSKIYLTTYISLRSSIRNRKHICIGKKVIINCNVILWPIKLNIGADSQLNPGTAIYGIVNIGKNVMIGPNCMISGGNHNFNSINIPMSKQGSNEKGIIIEDDVWIGANSVILDGVTIGKGTIVGAGSVVSKNLNSYSIYFGNPVKFYKKRNAE